MPITILVADDHAILRQGLRALLEDQNDFRVVGEASNGREAVQMVKETRPNVLIVDIMMPEMNGLEVARQVSKEVPDTRTIILSMHAKESYIQEAIKNGAAAYVLKESQTSELIQAVREVMKGKHFLSAPLGEWAIDAYFARAKQFAADDFDLLTRREREVFQMVAEGLSTQEIADKLNLSARTVDVHRARIMQKLRLRNQTDLIRLAIQKGIIPEE